MNTPLSLLFVCMGNICRSPAAEGIMNRLLEKEGLEDRVHCDSAGTIGFHAGNPADSRMRRTASARGYELLSRSRPIERADLAQFDWILTMDNENLEDVRALDPSGKYHEKIRPMCSFCRARAEREVPDPYYGGDRGFDQVIDLLEDACAGFLEFLKENDQIPSKPA